MDDTGVGLMVRAVRLRAGLTQTELAARAGSSRSTVSRLEAGDLESMTIQLLRRISQALAMPPLLSLGWRGAEVAQLLDAGHASIVNRVVRVLLSSGWQPIVEFTFSHYGERGSVDILAWHAPTQTLLLIEVKTRIVDLQDLVGTMDRKLRVVPHLVEADREWRPKHTGSLLVLPSNSATRAVVERHSAIFDATLPARTVAVRRWVAAPSGDLRGIWFLQNSRTEGSE